MVKTVNGKRIILSTLHSKYIFGTWIDSTVKELYVNDKNYLFYAVYDEGNNTHKLELTTASDVISFMDECGKNKIHIRWFPGGKELLQQVVNNAFKKDDDFTK